MKLQYLASSCLAIILGLNCLSPLLAQTSTSKEEAETKPKTTNPPAETYRPGFWQPVARFNPKEKVTLKLVNDSGFVLNYDDTTQETSDPKDLAIAKSDTLQNVRKSAYIMVYPAGNVDPETPFTLKFNVAVDQATNLVTVTITKAEKSFIGHRTINLQKTGGIYFY